MNRTETMPMFGEEELAGMEADKFKRGSWWAIDHVHRDQDGKVDQRYVTTGQVISRGVWDNQFRIDWQTSTTLRGSMYAQRVEDYVEESTIDMYTGRHYTLPHRVWMSLIEKSRPLDDSEVDEFKVAAQGFYDEWCWTQDEFARWTAGVPDDTTGLFVPEFTNLNRECSHGGRWSRSTLGTFCRACKAQISTTVMPGVNERSCMWWMYKGSMGSGTPREHPDDCHWCQMDREKLERLEKEKE